MGSLSGEYYCHWPIFMHEMANHFRLKPNSFLQSVRLPKIVCVPSLDWAHTSTCNMRIHGFVIAVVIMHAITHCRSGFMV